MQVVDEYLEHFEAYLISEQRSSANTVEAYLNDIGQFYTFLSLSEINLVKVQRSEIESFLQAETERKISSRTVARRLAALKTFGVFLKKKYNIVLPVVGLEQPRWRKPLPKCLSEIEIKAIFDCAKKDVTAKGIRNWTILSLLYSLGLRVSELISLDVKQIRLDEGFVRVIGKGDKERTVSLTDEVCNILGVYISGARKTMLKHWQISAGSYKQKGVFECKTTRLFFSCSKGRIKKLTRQAVSVMFQSLAGSAGIIQKVSPHIMRHSIATHLLGRGADLRTLQTFLGHENISTVQIYTHVDMTRLRAAYDKKHPRSS